MSVRIKHLSALYLGLIYFSIPIGGQVPHHDHQRTLPDLPMSSPFSAVDAVKLPEWNQIRKLTERLQTDQGSLELLQEMPLIREKYGDDSYFLELVRKWRSRVPVLQFKPNADDNSSWVVIQNGQARTISITFYDEIPENSITILAITWVDKQVTNISFTGGFDNVLGKRRKHHDHPGWSDHFPEDNH